MFVLKSYVRFFSWFYEILSSFWKSLLKNSSHFQPMPFVDFLKVATTYCIRKIVEELSVWRLFDVLNSFLFSAKTSYSPKSFENCEDTYGINLFNF